MAGERLPRPTEITMQRQRGEPQRVIPMFARQLGQKRARDLGLDLVLDGDVGAKAVRVLRAERAVEAVGEAIA